MTDLAHLQDLVEGQDRGAELIVKHPVTGALTDIVLTIAGPDSDVQRRARLMMQDEMMAFRGRPPAGEYERMDLDRLARCVVAWRGMDAPFSFSAVVKLFKDVPFVREQVEEFSKSRVDYFLRLTP